MEVVLTKVDTLTIKDGEGKLKSGRKKAMVLSKSWIEFGIRASITCQKYLDEKPFKNDVVQMAVGDDVADYNQTDGSLSFKCNGKKAHLSLEQMLGMRENKDEIMSELKKFNE